jgi:hypothetical protein
MELTERQPVHALYEVLFFECPLCLTAVKIVRHSSKLAIIIDPAARVGGSSVSNIIH